MSPVTRRGALSLTLAAGGAVAASTVALAAKPDDAALFALKAEQERLFAAAQAIADEKEALTATCRGLFPDWEGQKAERAAAEERAGLPAICARWEAACEESRASYRLFMEASAYTLAGIILKARELAWGDDPDALVVLADLERLAGEA